jgi:hypothetical protein
MPFFQGRASQIGADKRRSNYFSFFFSVMAVRTSCAVAFKLTQIDVIYSNFDTYVQREVIGSMYPEKFTFENLQHRTAKIDFLFQLVYQINSTLLDKKR